MRRFSKAIAALVGGITPPVVVAILAAFGVHLGLDQAGEIVGGLSALLALLATLAAPPNAPATVDGATPTDSADGSVSDAGSGRP